MQYIDRIGHDSLPDEGVALDSIARGIQGGTYGKVKEEIENLLSEGMLYTTMDEDQCVKVDCMSAYILPPANFILLQCSSYNCLRLL